MTAHQLPPDLARRWHIERALGRGGSATTFAATRLEDGREVALKVLRLDTMSDWKVHELFEREANALARVRNKGVPRFIERVVSEDGRVVALAQELIPGPTLRERVDERGRMPEHSVRTLAAALLRVLDGLQRMRPAIVHRDVKPSNVVLAPQGVHLVDFGGVHFVGAGGTRNSVVGTFGFMAPEQLWGESTTASDVFSVGMTALFALTAEEPETFVRDGLVVDVPRLVSVARGFSKWLQQMVAAEPQQRFKNARAALKALQDLEPPRRDDQAANALLGGQRLVIEHTLDRFAVSPKRWKLPVPEQSRETARSRTVARATCVWLGLDEEGVSLDWSRRGRKPRTLEWSEIDDASVGFGVLPAAARHEVYLRLGLGTEAGPIGVDVRVTPDEAAAIVGEIWPRVARAKRSTITTPSLGDPKLIDWLGVRVPRDLARAPSKVIARLGARMDVRCRFDATQRWTITAVASCRPACNVFIANSSRRASPSAVAGAFLADRSAKAAWLALAASPPDRMEYTDLQVLGDRFIYSATSRVQPSHVDRFELAAALIVQRMMTFRGVAG